MRWTLDQWRVFERWSLPRVGTCEDQTLVILVILVKMSDTCMVDILDTCRHTCNNNNIENDDFVSNTTGCIRLRVMR